MTLPELLATIFTFNLMTFGNGTIMIPLLQATLVEDRHVLTLDQMLYAFTVGRVTPGQANLYLASVGYMLFGVVGSVGAMAVLIVPSYVMLPMLGGYERLRNLAAIRGLTRGLTSASVGLIFAATLSIGRESLTTPTAWVVFPFTLVLIAVLKWNPFVSLLLASALGLGLRGLGIGGWPGG